MALNEDDPSGVQTLTASVAEIQGLADQILERLGVRIRAGQMVIHYHDGVVQRVETNTVHRPGPRMGGLHESRAGRRSGLTVHQSRRAPTASERRPAGDAHRAARNDDGCRHLP